MDNKDNPLPTSARVFPLRKGTKQPATRNGHLDASSSDLANVISGDYGIALDGQFVVVDVDYPEKLKDDARFQSLWGTTWTQQTKKGNHFLYTVPEGFKGKNARLPNQAGDIKVNGYIVGPGSVVDGHTYSVINAGEPTQAPKWLLDMVVDTRERGMDGQEDVGEKELQVKEGEGRNQFLTKCAGSLRGLGMGVEQSKKLLRSINGSTCVPPLSEIELRTTIDHSIEKWSRGEFVLESLIQPAYVLQASAVTTIREPLEYMLRPLIPKIGLTLMHGTGGVGKSTFASFVTAQATKREVRVLLLCTEEDPLLHIQRAIHMGADADYIYWPDPQKVRVNSIKFPNNAPQLDELIKQLGLGFVYIDAIQTHADPTQTKNMHAGEKARVLVAEVAALAIKHRIPILGTYHNNKGSDTAQGSEELANTARQQLSLTRVTKGGEKRVSIQVDKSNGPDDGKIVQFAWAAKEYQDTETGEFQKEIIEDDIDSDTYREGYSEIKNQLVPYITVVKKSEQTVSESTYTAPVRDKAAQAVLDILSHGDWMLSNVVKETVMGQTEAGLESVKSAISSLLAEGRIRTQGKSQNTAYQLISTFTI